MTNQYKTQRVNMLAKYNFLQESENLRSVYGLLNKSVLFLDHIS